VGDLAGERINPSGDLRRAEQNAQSVHLKPSGKSKFRPPAAI
jgi:hypothetical protein